MRNETADPLIADSLIVVLDSITNLAGEEREPLKNEPLLSRFDVLGQDGETDDRKPFSEFPLVPLLICSANRQQAGIGANSQ